MFISFIFKSKINYYLISRCKGKVFFRIIDAFRVFFIKNYFAAVKRRATSAQLMTL